jgi:TPR repeat protein
MTKGVPDSLFRERFIFNFQSAGAAMKTICSVAFCLLLSLSCVLIEANDDKKADPTHETSPEALFASILVNAEKGQPQAMLSLGILYEQGLGVFRNFTKALEWYEKAALAGEKEAYFRIGLCYEMGMGTVADLGKAAEAYGKGASLASATSMHKMATLYLVGRGVPKDETKGLTLLSSAAEAGNAMATNELAVVYLQGLLGQKKDSAKAKELFLKSAEGGNLEAIKNLAVMLRDGIGQKADPTAALRWYLIAQKGGFQAQDLDSVIGELKKTLPEAQVKKINTEAEMWLKAYTERENKTKI